MYFVPSHHCWQTKLSSLPIILSDPLQVIRRNVTGVWIGSTAWSLHNRLTSLPNIQRVGTVLGFTDMSQTLDRLIPYIQGLLIKLSQEKSDMSRPATKAYNNPCPECWDLSPDNISLVKDAAVQRSAFSVYAAIYSVADALHKLLECSSTACMWGSETKIYPWKVMFVFFVCCYSWLH